MSYYIAIDSYGDISLEHHGIKGMQWGIRRFQNKDGSLTAAGIKRYQNAKERYSRGKAYSKTYDELTEKETEALKNKSQEYRYAAKEASRLAEKYHLDSDDSDEEDDDYEDDHEDFTEADLQYARQRHKDLSESMAAMDEEFYEKAQEKAKSILSSKYGSSAINDIDYYKKMQGAKAAAIALAAIGASFLLSR